MTDGRWFPPQAALQEHKKIIETRRKSCGAYCLQDWEELACLALCVAYEEPPVVVEIGSCEFGWLWIMAPFFREGATIIGIDPLTKKIIRRDRVNMNLTKLKAEGYDAHFIEGMSHEPWVINDMLRILNGRRIDLLHIDGAHGYKAVKCDWETYRPHVAKDGIIVFHDIRSRAAAEEVYRLWDDIKADGCWPTIQIGDKPRVGIGIVRNNRDTRIIEGRIDEVGWSEMAYRIEFDQLVRKRGRAGWISIVDSNIVKAAGPDCHVEGTRFNAPPIVVAQALVMRGREVRVCLCPGPFVASIEPIEMGGSNESN